MTDLVLIFVVALCVIGDGLTTFLALRAGGRERIPLVARLIGAHGLLAGLLIGKGVQLAAVLLVGFVALSNPGLGWLMLAPLALYLFICAGNLAVAKEMRRRHGLTGYL